MNNKQRFRSAVDRRLSGLREDPWLARRIMDSEKGAQSVNTAKRKFQRPVIAAAIVLACFIAAGTVAFALGQVGIGYLFTLSDKSNENIADVIQTMDFHYDGRHVSLSVNEALYDDKGGSFALGWNIENHDNSDLYIVCDGILLGDKEIEYRTVTNHSDYVLSGKSTADCAVLGTLPESDSNVCTMTFTALRPLAPFVQLSQQYGTGASEEEQSEAAREEGKIPLGADGHISAAGLELLPTHTETLLATGQFEPAERFSLCFEVDTGLVDQSIRTYSGQKDFVFDDYEMRIRSAYTTAATACIEVEYITEEKPLNDEHFGPLWELSFKTPDGSIWTGNAGGSWVEPVLLEDGRWLSVYKYHALQLFEQPEVLRITLTTYEQDGTQFIPTEHTEDTIELTFE